MIYYVEKLDDIKLIFINVEINFVVSYNLVRMVYLKNYKYTVERNFMSIEEFEKLL